jgi:uridine kinase
LSTNVIVVVIAGASGSGKSSLALNVSQRLNKDFRVDILHEDSYYRRQSDLDIEQRAKTNYDHPDAIEESLLVEHVAQLKSAKFVEVPVYDYEIHDRSDDAKACGPCDVLIVEGILLLHRDAIRSLSDLCIFVDVPEEICLERRIERDISQRGRTRESVLEQYEKTVGPMFRKYVAPSKQHAELVVTEGGHRVESIQQVVDAVTALVLK